MPGPKLSWKKTLHLPKSGFPARTLVKDRPTYLQRCTDDLYVWQRSRQKLKSFTLHDGPPYANGELHIGHALNKILKDIICRSRLPNHRVDWRPGWDCHGLPIELKALQEQGERASSNAVSIRAAARHLAAKAVQNQKRTFRKWGIMADWDNAWTTMDKHFEIKQLGVFKEMAEKGLIYRRFKPVYWSPSSWTALAEAELEYQDDHVSIAAFVKYPLTSGSMSLRGDTKIPLDDVSAVIWTTTPWTLPANKAIGINKEVEYKIAESLTHGRLLVASSRLYEVEHHLNESLRNIISIDGEELIGTTYADRVFDTKCPPRPLLHADFVSETSGTGLVHLAPGHGMDDYELCLNHGIIAFAPVNDEGRFTSVAYPEEPQYLQGKEVLGSGNQAVLDRLNDRRQLLAQHQYTHNYPYDWRSKRPVIVRATEQWFANAGEIQRDALEALESVRFIPPSSLTRLRSFVKNRSEWCISRQRAWGVPIPALYHIQTDETVLSKDSVSHIISVIRERGIEAWWTDDEFDPAWTPPPLRSAHGESLYRRGEDTMDVWFDSGTSWTQTDNKSDIARHVADCYIEGTDQHRGWFQSSLLTHVANQCSLSVDETRAIAPFRTLVTHGFTLDQNGRKMSKSVGNVVSPDEIMEGTLLPVMKRKVDGKLTDARDAMGPDALRLWVAGCDYTTDVKISHKVLQAINGSLSKYRVTFKLILGLLENFDPSNHVLPENLGMVHQIVLWRLDAVNDKVQSFYNTFEFSKAVNEINKFIINDLSSSYFEWIKDAAYCGTAEERLQVQGTLFQVYRHLQQMLAPITPLLIEETWDYTPKQIKDHEMASPGQRPWSKPDWKPESYSRLPDDFPHLMEARATIKSVQEAARKGKTMGDSLESWVYFKTESEIALELFTHYGIQQLQTLFGVSCFAMDSNDAHFEGLRQSAWSYKGRFEVLGKEVLVHVYEPQLAKCVRCWRYAAPVEKAKVEAVCGRCEVVVDEMRRSNPELFE